MTARTTCRCGCLEIVHDDRGCSICRDACTAHTPPDPEETPVTTEQPRIVRRDFVVTVDRFADEPAEQTLKALADALMPVLGHGAVPRVFYWNTEASIPVYRPEHLKGIRRLPEDTTARVPADLRDAIPATVNLTRFAELTREHINYGDSETYWFLVSLWAGLLGLRYVDHEDADNTDTARAVDRCLTALHWTSSFNPHRAATNTEET